MLYSMDFHGNKPTTTSIQASALLRGLFPKGPFVMVVQPSPPHQGTTPTYIQRSSTWKGPGSFLSQPHPPMCRIDVVSLISPTQQQPLPS